MKVYNMTIPTKDFRAKFCTCHCFSKHELCYHAHCSIVYLACVLVQVGGIVISCDSEVINDRQDMEEGGTCE